MKKVSCIILSLIIMLCCVSVISTNVQASSLASDKVLEAINSSLIFQGTPVQGEIISVVELKDGSVVGVGSSLEYLDQRADGDTDTTGLVVKYNPDGTIAFFRTFGGNASDRFNNVIPTLDGGFLVSGYSSSSSEGDFSKYNISCSGDKGHTIVLKYNKYGDVLWLKGPGKYKLDQYQSIKEDSNGNIIGIAYTFRRDIKYADDIIDYTQKNNFLIKLDSNGNSLLSDEAIRIKNFNSDVYDMDCDNDGNVFTCGTNNEGYAESIDSNGQKFNLEVISASISKISERGEVLFLKKFSEIGGIMFDEIGLTSDNQIIVGGRVNVRSKTPTNLSLPIQKGTIFYGPLVVKFDKQGKTIGADYIQSREIDQDGRIMTHGSGIPGLRILSSLDNGKTLVQYDDSYGLNDPISGLYIKCKDKTVYLYCVDANGHFEYISSITSKNFIGPYGGISSLYCSSDGTFRIISAENSEYQPNVVNISNVVNKFNLAESIVRAKNINPKIYTIDTIYSLSNSIKAAVRIKNSSEAAQIEVDQAKSDLVKSIDNLVVSTGNCPKFSAGDADGDGKITIRDATVIQKYLAKIIKLTDIQINAADIGKNGYVSIKEATIIQKYLAKIMP